MYPKISKKLFWAAFLTLMSLIAQKNDANAQGAKNALTFTNSGDKPHVDLGTSLMNQIDTVDYTIEFWANIDPAITSDPSIIANKDWGSGNNKGFIIARRNSSQLKVNFRTDGSTDRFDMNIPYPSSYYGKWHHIAIVFKRQAASPEVIAYVDGEQAVSLGITAAENATGKMISTHNLMIGQDGTGNYSTNYMGKLDEVRFWKSARTETEIRSKMCQKLSGSETHLLSCYRMDATSGTTLTDLTSNYNGTLTQNSGTALPAWGVSGAAIGDTSAYHFSSSFTGVNVNLGSTAGGTALLNNMGGTAKGVFLYHVNSSPNDSTGIAALSGNNTYYGVYVSGDSLGYDLTYNYTNMSNAITFENSIQLYNRNGNDAASWADALATKNTTANTLKVSRHGVKEYIIGNFANTCNAPATISTDSISYGFVTVKWITGGASMWNIEYGSAGFTQGSGTMVTGVTANPYTIYGLSGATAYDFYVQDSCTSIGTSTWTGPFNFTTLTAPACNVPTNLNATVTYNSAELSWTTGGSSNWNLEWGPAGFAQGTGTMLTNITTNPKTISALTPSTAYQFYVQDTCNLVNTSAWAGPFNFSTLANYANIGSGTAIDISGANTWVDVSNNGGGAKVSAASLGLPDSTLTLEAWFKPREFGKWRSIISFLQDNGSFERGFDIETRNGNKFAFALCSDNSSDSSLTYMETTNSFTKDKWYHLAATYDGDTMKLYVNGVLEATSTTEKGPIKYADSWLSIGAYKDDNEEIPVNGLIDEVRIWKITKTQAQIRAEMCHKLTGNEPGLVHYYTLNDGAGTAVTDKLGTANGVLKNIDPTTGWKVSGAPIGDASVYTYKSDYTGTTLSLSSTNRGDVEVSSIVNTPEGVHIYKVNDVPNFTNGIADLGNQNVYYGTFVANGQATGVTYKLDYKYGNYANATTNENFLNIYNRNSNSGTTWVNSGASRDATNDKVVYSNIGTRREFILSDFQASSCAGSTGLNATNITYSSATLKWTSSASNFNVEYGISGFNLGSGTRINGLVTNQKAVSNLLHTTNYDFYVQDSCSASSKSGWVGPFTFTTKNPCPNPADFKLVKKSDKWVLLEWTNGGGTTKWNVEWGTKGFSQGFGIKTTLNNNPDTLKGLSPDTEYDFYLREDCDTLKSGWIGPVQVKTDTTSTVGVETIYGAENEIKMYPNPTEGIVFLESAVQNEKLEVEVFNFTGAVIKRQTWMSSSRLSIDLNEFPSGTYLMRVTSANNQIIKKILLK